jgi:hypothetical protein
VMEGYRASPRFVSAKMSANVHLRPQEADTRVVRPMAGQMSTNGDIFSDVDIRSHLSAFVLISGRFRRW